jgi:hypothetical protein
VDQAEGRACPTDIDDPVREGGSNEEVAEVDQTGYQNNNDETFAPQ